MPGVVPRTFALALNNATLPFTLALANQGCKQALLKDQGLLNDLNICKGSMTHAAVARDLGYELVAVIEALS